MFMYSIDQVLPKTENKMKQIFVHYCVRDDKVKENEKYIKEVFDELHKLELENIKYSVFRMGTNVFIHIARFKNEKANLRFSQLPAFKEFLSSVKDRLSEPPISNDVIEIGSYLSKNSF